MAQGMQHPLLAKSTFGENAMIRKYMTNLKKQNIGRFIRRNGGELMYAYYFLSIVECA